MVMTVTVKRAAELLGVSEPTVRGMIDHPKDVGFELGFRLPSQKSRPERRSYRVYANVLAEKLHMSLEDVRCEE